MRQRWLNQIGPTPPASGLFRCDRRACCELHPNLEGLRKVYGAALRLAQLLVNIAVPVLDLSLGQRKEIPHADIGDQ